MHVKPLDTGNKSINRFDPCHKIPRNTGSGILSIRNINININRPSGTKIARDSIMSIMDISNIESRSLTRSPRYLGQHK